MTVDLRLVPVALVAWVAAWCLTGPAAGAAGPAAVIGAAVCVGAASWWYLGARVRARRVPGPGRAVAGGRSRGRNLRSAVCHLVLVAACLTALGASVHVQTAARGPLGDLAEDGAVGVLHGTVASASRPAGFGDGRRWVMAVTRLEARGSTSAVRAHVAVTAPGDPPRYGASVTVPVRLDVPRFGAGMVAEAAASGPVDEAAPPGRVGRLTHTMRTALLAVSADLSPQARGLVPGAAVGDTSRVPDDVDQAMRDTGLTHVTAVSGGHFAVVVTVVTALCVVLRLPRAVRVAVLAAVGTGFVLLVRPEPSVLRAAWTCAVALLGLALGRPSAGPAALAVAATTLLVVDPWQSRSFGFALSCAATAGIVLLTGPLARRLAPWCGGPGAFALAVPVAAQLACGPVLVLLAPALPVTSVPANLLAAPALIPATVLGLLATLLAPWAPGVAAAVAWVAGLATAWIAAVAEFFAGLPGAVLPWPGGVGGALALAGATAALLVLVLRRPPGQGWPPSWRAAVGRAVRAASGRVGPRSVAVLLLALVLPAGAAAVVVARGHGPDPTAQVWQVVACDVGQGDTLVVRTGAASAVVVDVGPPGDAAARCLDRLGVTRIDLLVLSHFHTDHVGGLTDVLGGREVGGALVSPRGEPSGPARRARAALRTAGVPVTVAAAGQQGTAGAVTWRVLGARDAGGGADGDGANDASVVVSMRTQDGLDIVALGDLEEAGQEGLLRDLLAAGLPDDPVEIVKMAHHGSASQSAGLARLLAPQVVLVPVGENDYGHPTDSALELYATTGARLVRTDRCGTAMLVRGDDGPGLLCSG
ncbi:ComEC/Rec2 family competence protein [Isoptericola aurantiacus]|uniref:ComEC/Rec2 family competence protein n=1 Tax=Isoptericola aurantiacus TaxID=3377839 RepID=UPI00383ADCD2